jgi:acetyltransferase-like isoleucine patch superfamily enzyme
MILELYGRIKFWASVDRIGPDNPLNHWMLHFKTTMRKLCTKKFSYFGEGADFRPGAYAICCKNIKIGKRVVIRPGTMLHASADENIKGEIILEDDVMLGSGIHIYVDKHNFSDPSLSILDQGWATPNSVVLQKGCWIGSASIILPGVTIGQRSVVYAGSVITKSLPEGVIAGGNPCRVIGKIPSI